MPPCPFTVRRATIDDILDVRHRVLRKGLPRDSANFDHDHDATTVHVAAVDNSNFVMGAASMLFNHVDNTPAWQLRGMAVDENWHRQGVGKALLAWLETHVVAPSDTHLQWCNARLIAVPFYQRLGWRIVSDPFDIPTAGPHYKMRKDEPTLV